MARFSNIKNLSDKFNKIKQTQSEVKTKKKKGK